VNTPASGCFLLEKYEKENLVISYDIIPFYGENISNLATKKEEARTNTRIPGSHGNPTWKKNSCSSQSERSNKAGCLVPFSFFHVQYRCMNKNSTRLSRERIREVLHSGKRLHKGAFTYFTLPHSPIASGLGGFAVVVPKTIVPLSSARNRLKRITREFLRKIVTTQHIDLVFIMRSSNEDLIKNFLQTLGSL
jgi:ribonuclease P protein component